MDGPGALLSLVALIQPGNHCTDFHQLMYGVNFSLTTVNRYTVKTWTRLAEHVDSLHLRPSILATNENLLWRYHRVDRRSLSFRDMPAGAFY